MFQSKGNIIQLCNNPVKQYEWGFTNQDCYVGQLSGKANCKHYAEMWMGVHCNGQSQVINHQNIEAESKQPTTKLSEYFRQHHLKPIQFLFKVLSINKSLSIQVHPNKEQAIQLNQQRASIYTDPNDKPEMFYTLSTFQCFLGYITQQKFQKIKHSKPFSQVFKAGGLNKPKDMIVAILKLSENEQHQLVKQSLKHLKQLHPDRYNQQNKKSKIHKILQDFPFDIGNIISLFLQYKVFNPGSCYYIQCNTPHAYISGQCLQIMKNSDNVCRLGLTPKFKDLSVIQKVLGNNVQQLIPINPSKIQMDDFIQQLYHTAGLYFLIIKTKEGENQQSQMQITSNKQLRICLIIQGVFSIQSETKEIINKQIYKKGTVLLIQSNTKYKVKRQSNQKGLICIGWSSY